MKIKRTVLSVVALSLTLGGLCAVPDGYIYDYYDSGTTPGKFLKNYTGKAYNGVPKVAKSGLTKIQAEDFDGGAAGKAYSFKNGGDNGYRRDKAAVSIGKTADGWSVGNVSSGHDWLCYTIDVAQPGEYRISASTASDDRLPYYFEVDGDAAGSMLYATGNGWDTYTLDTTDGVYLTKGRHVIKWVPAGGINFDWFALERMGDYKKPASNMTFDYPRTSVYTDNPLFLDFTSPMKECGLKGALYTADPSAHVWNIDGRDVLYVYASHDLEPPRGCDYMDRYHIFSTEDLVNWTDHGEVMNAATSNAVTGIGSDGFMWAPDCGYNPADSLYYFIYPHKLSNVEDVWGIFVATSRTPAGPFDPKGYIKGVPSVIDPCLFVDDDGQPYIYVGGGGKGCWGGKLRRDDWTKLDGEMKQLGSFEDFHEAPWVHKYNGKYYLSHSDNNFENNHLRYSVADDPLGPYTPKGVYMLAHGHDTTHGSIVRFKDKWYQFYHTADYSGRGNLRSVCFDELVYNPDGSIAMVNTWGEPYLSTPITLLASAPLTVPAVNYNRGKNSKGYFTCSKKAPGRDADFVTLGAEEWLRFSINVEKRGTYKVNIRLRQSIPNSRLAVLEDAEYLTSMRGEYLPDKASTGWQDMVLELPLHAGEHFIELRVKRGDISIENFTLSFETKKLTSK